MDDKVYSNKLLKNGRLTIPAKVRKLLGLRPGDLVDFVEEGGHTFLRRIPKPDASTGADHRTSSEGKVEIRVA